MTVTTDRAPLDSANSVDNQDVDVAAQRSRLAAQSVIAALDAHATELEAEAEGNEQTGRLSDRTLELLRQIGIPSLMISESSGGMALFPGDALTVLDRLSQIDATIGWVGGNWSSAGLLLSYFEKDAVDRLLDGGQPLFAATSTPTGRAVPTVGGYLVSGTWSYGTGIKQATWVLCTAVVLDSDGQPAKDPMGNPLTRLFAAPASPIEDKGNWDTLGLRATSSIDFGVSETFVPNEFVMDMSAEPRTGERQHSGGFMVMLSMLHTSFALGTSRRLLDELAAHAQRPSSRGTSLAENPVFRAEFARREITVRSARALVYEAWQAIDTRLKAGERPTLRDNTLMRAAMVHMHDVARETATFVFNKTMGVSLRSGTLNRRVRDTLSGCQHLLVQDSVYPDIAKELMGNVREPAMWTPFGLVELG